VIEAISSSFVEARMFSALDTLSAQTRFFASNIRRRLTITECDFDTRPERFCGAAFFQSGAAVEWKLVESRAGRLRRMLRLYDDMVAFGAIWGTPVRAPLRVFIVTCFWLRTSA